MSDIGHGSLSGHPRSRSSVTLIVRLRLAGTAPLTILRFVSHRPGTRPVTAGQSILLSHCPAWNNFRHRISVAAIARPTRSRPVASEAPAAVLEINRKRGEEYATAWFTFAVGPDSASDKAAKTWRAVADELSFPNPAPAGPHRFGGAANQRHRARPARTDSALIMRSDIQWSFHRE